MTELSSIAASPALTAREGAESSDARPRQPRREAAGRTAGLQTGQSERPSQAGPAPRAAAFPESLKPQLHRMVEAGKTHGQCAKYFRTARGLALSARDISAALGMPVAGESHRRRIREALARKRELTLDDLVRMTGSTRQRIRCALREMTESGEITRCAVDGVAIFSMAAGDE